MIKQVIVVRKNLGMRKGKIASQCCHASMGVLIKDSTFINDDGEGNSLMVTKLSNDMMSWLQNSFTKIVLYVNTNEDFYELMETLDNQDDIPYYKITDNGTTEFKGVKTDTCVAIGPAEDWKIDVITGHLNLL